jgi:hypothetical protein
MEHGACRAPTSTSMPPPGQIPIPRTVSKPEIGLSGPVEERRYDLALSRCICMG